MALAEAYAAHGHDVVVLSYDDLPTGCERVADVVFPAGVAWGLWRRRHALDVVEASLGDAAWWCRLPVARRAVLAVRSHGLEHLLYDHQRADVAARGEPLSWRYRVYRERVNLPRVARTMRAADAVFVVNEHEVTLATDRLGVEPARVHLVGQGVDDALIGAGALRPLVPSDPVIVCLSRWDRAKGIEHLVPALTEVLAARHDVRVRLLGTGVGADSVRAEFPADRRDRVDVVPRFERPDLVRLVGNARVAVHAAVREGSPVALLELMALGLAPVATAIPGVAEVLTPETGVLVPPRDVPALRDALLRLLADEVLAARVGAAARASVATRGWSRLAAENVERYRTLLAER